MMPLIVEAMAISLIGLSCATTTWSDNRLVTIDSDYRGEIKVPLINFDTAPQRLERGDRIAQLVLAAVLQIE